MKRTSTGFPADVRSPFHLLVLLRIRKAHINPVSTHLNSEPAGRLHNLMWQLSKDGFVNVEHVNLPEFSDVRFDVSLTIKGSELINHRIVMIAAIVGAVAGIIGWFT
jgi:hypothetical protein